MKYSRQRELIRETVNQAAGHPTADAVYQLVRQKEPTISLATVYRNLNQLAENHMIRRVVVPGDSDHFDRTLEYHEHMICTGCGSVVDVWPAQPLAEQFRSFLGVRCTGYELVLYGLCPACAGQESCQQTESATERGKHGF